MGGAVVQSQFARRLVEHRTTREDHVGDIAREFVHRLRADDPLVRLPQDAPRVVDVQLGEAHAIQGAGGRLAYAVIDNKPPLAGASGWVERPILPPSHQARSRASRSTVWSPQFLKSGENDSHNLALAPAMLGTGR